MRAAIRRLLVVLLAAVFGLAAVVGWYVNEIRLARQQTESLVSEAWQVYGRSIALTDLSPARLSVLLAIEDPEFFHHHGVDLATPGAGMTTITQGLVKLLYFPDGFQPGIAKIKQTLIARYAVDGFVSKQEQLELFLNSAYLGNDARKPVHGFAAAASRYFGKDFNSLTDPEFTALVVMLIAPDRLRPGSTAHSARMQRVESYLAGHSRPASVLDVDYSGKARGTFFEEALMVLLRFAT